MSGALEIARNLGKVTERFRGELDTVLGTPDWTLQEHHGSDYTPAERYYLTLDGRTVAYFTLAAMPGCCGILISTHAYVGLNWHGKGLGKLLNRVRIELARRAGYGLLLCTDKVTNTAQRKVLAANGWQDVYQFINPRTDNKVCISVVPLGGL